MSTVTIPGLFKRKGIWTYRRVIMPRHLAPIIGRTEIVVSLRTRDLAEAIALAEVERKKVDALIAEAKKIAVGPDGRPNPEQAAQAWKRKALADLRERLQGRPVVTGAHRAERNSHDLDVESRAITSRMENVTRSLRRGGLSRAEHAHNWSVEQGILESSPCDGVTKLPRSSIEDDERGRVPFTAARKEDVRRDISASEPWRGGCGWIPYVLAFTGMRLAEATGLRKCDVVKDDDTGVWYFDVVNHPLDPARSSPRCADAVRGGMGAVTD